MKLGRSVVFAMFVFAVACSEDKGQLTTQPGETAVWKLEEKPLAFGSECTDAASLRKMVTDQWETYSYVAYKVSEDGAKARMQDCGTPPVKTACKDDAEGIELTVDGATLLYQPAALRFDVPSFNCKIVVNQTWDIREEGDALVGSISGVAVLEGADCASVESGAKMMSTNQKGVTGCLITATVLGARQP